jgi:rRNA-processing protein FCF1
MIFIVPDSNAFHGGRWLSSFAGQNLINLAAAGKCQVTVPQVVVDELERQYRETLTKQRDEAKTALRAVRSLVDIDDIIAKFDQVLREIVTERDALLARVGIRAVPVPENITRDLVQRDLGRRRPFTETEGTKRTSFGFRDAVIWETLLDTAMMTGSEDTVFFVTRDTGFLAKNQVDRRLHSDLVRDLEDRGIDKDRVVVIDALPNVVEAINTSVAEAAAEDAEAMTAADSLEGGGHDLASLLRGYAIGAAHRAELVRVSLEALQALIGEEVTEKLGYGGDYHRPNFARFDFPSTIESAVIAAIDLESDFVFGPPNGDTVSARVDVVASIEGYTYKGNYYVERHDDLELVGELDDNYFETSATVHARAVIEIDIEGGPGHFDVSDIVLEDSPSPSASNVLTRVELDFGTSPEPAVGSGASSEQIYGPPS